MTHTVARKQLKQYLLGHGEFFTTMTTIKVPLSQGGKQAGLKEVELDLKSGNLQLKVFGDETVTGGLPNPESYEGVVPSDAIIKSLPTGASVSMQQGITQAMKTAGDEDRRRLGMVLEFLTQPSQDPNRVTVVIEGESTGESQEDGTGRQEVMRSGRTLA